MGLLERHGGEVRCQIVPGTSTNILDPQVRHHVEAGATVYTDAHGAYEKLDNAFAALSITRRSTLTGRFTLKELEKFGRC